jgi:hypothetical protein
MATLRNLALAILRLAGATSIAAALRHHSRPPDRPFRPLYPVSAGNPVALCGLGILADQTAEAIPP